MQAITDNTEILSPFHSGEQEIQTRVGKRDVMESFGRRVIRSSLPRQHQNFYAQLPFIVVGSVDRDGWPWASILSGKPGFISSPDSTTVLVNASSANGDPLQDSTNPGSPLGLLGIEMHTRRRNRVNAHVTQSEPSELTLAVDQAFGNCPQYIQSRTVDFIRDPGSPAKENDFFQFTSLDEDARALIAGADTFFVSSYVQTEQRPEIEGVDVSHRGGRPGFVKVENNTLTIPDYTGNFHFNTLGNFLVNPKAGLIFVDFESGNLLTLTGVVEILWEEEAEVKAFEGAERAWRFTIDHGLWLRNALPFRSTFQGYSNNTLITGDWQQAAAVIDAEARRDAWRPYSVVKIEEESSVIKSFYFEPTDKAGLLSFEAGQFLTIRINDTDSNNSFIRTYTVSSAPGDPHYRISVKHEPEGLGSNILHNHMRPGDTIEAKAPSGDFFIDPAEARPAVLIAGGVGITPMVSMASHVVNEGRRTRYFRPTTILHSAQTTEQRAFFQAFQNLERSSGGSVKYYSFISKHGDLDQAGADFNEPGRITVDVIRQILSLDDYDFFLCGPPAFMQGIYDSVRSLGARDSRIHAESFGPASLIRQPDEGSILEVEEEEAEEAIIQFQKSNFEQRWNAGEPTILEIAEEHGLTPEYGCRNGVCGTCKVKLKSGKTAYRTRPSATHDRDEVLICCAVPAKDTDTLIIDL